MQGVPSRVAECYKLLIEVGPMFGYLPKPEKSFVVYPLTSEENVLAALGSEGLDVKAYRGHRYVGRYVGYLEMRNCWIGPKVDSWATVVETIYMIACKYPQSAYHGVALSLQAMWQYLYRCIPGVEKHLAPVEQAIRTHLIHALLKVP